MKIISFTLLSIVFCLQAQANKTHEVNICENGSFAQLVDRHLIVEIYEDGFAFRPFTCSFGFDFADLNYLDGVFSTDSTKVTTHCQYFKETNTITFKAALNKDKSKLFLFLSGYPHGPFFNGELDCKRWLVDKDGFLHKL